MCSRSLAAPFIAVLAIAGWLASTAGAQVPPERLAALVKGVNLSHWLWLPQAKDRAGREAFISDAELRDLAAAGLTHVRLPFNPSTLWKKDSGELDSAALDEYRRAMDRCLAAKLAVVVDCHAVEASWFQPDAEGHLVDLEHVWAAVLPSLKKSDPARVFLEIVNEPHDLRDPQTWPVAQKHLLKLIRIAAPDHTIVVTGDSWGGIDGLLALEPLDDTNLLYSFHFYEPHNFTHQGATWGFAPWARMSHVPWPADAAALEDAAKASHDEQAAGALRWSASRDPWDAQRLAARIARVRDWARAQSKDHPISLYCGEFGVYAKSAAMEHRTAWLNALVRELGSNQNGSSPIGWCIWDYAGGFALAEGEPGKRTINPILVKCLGLVPMPGNP